MNIQVLRWPNRKPSEGVVAVVKVHYASDIPHFYVTRNTVGVRPGVGYEWIEYIPPKLWQCRKCGMLHTPHEAALAPRGRCTLGCTDILDPL